MKKRIITLILCISLLVLSFGVISVFAADGTSAAADKGTIDVYLIAGQSNAVGYGSGAPNSDDERFTKGFDNVLYYGRGEKNVSSDFVPVKVGLGKDTSSTGAEIGIASALSDNGKMNAVIKCAWGATYLYPNLTADISKTRGTWTSPTYLANHTDVDTSVTIASGDFAGNAIAGNMYSQFIKTVTNGIALLKEDGYTPVIKGIWWMQGEAEVYNEAMSNEYAELLNYLISDMRKDVGAIVGVDLSSLPFAMGKVARNGGIDYSTGKNYSQPPYAQIVRSAMQSAADNGTNIFTVECEGLAQLDGWHFNSDAQKWIGEQFINAVLTAEGNLVTDYGVIPAAYTNASAYPFAVFGGGEFLGAYATLGDAAQKAAEAGEGSQIILRQNATASEVSGVKNVNIDLCGYTLTSLGTVFTNSSVTVRNGKIAIGNADFIKMNADTNTAFAVTVENCSIDYSSAAAGVSLVDANDAENLADVSININGGEIISDNFASYSLYALGEGDSAMLGKYNGAYLTITLTSGASVPEVSYPTANGNAEFLKLETSGDKITYTLGVMNLSGYGEIPEKYASVEDYPLVVFYNGECIGAGNVWNTVAQTARGKIYGSANADKTASIVLRRDYTVTGRFYNTSQLGGTLVLDLGGYTMTANDYIFDGTAKHDGSGNSAETYKVCDTKLISVKNGTIAIKSRAVISFNVNTTLIKAKTFNFEFENITFKLSEGYTAGTNIITDVRNDTATNKPTANITLKNCTLDIMALRKTDKIIFFDCSDDNGANAVDISATVIGGTMLANELDHVVFFKGDGAGDKLVFAGKGGAYIKLCNDTLHASAPHSSIKLMGEGDTQLRFFRESLNGRNAVYTLKEDVKTDYGYIPYEYSDANTYPFVVFSKDKEFLGAYSYWLGSNGVGGALGGVRGYLDNAWDGSSYGDNPKEAYILMRRDYAYVSGKDTKYDNLAQTQGTIHVDLGGYMLSSGSVSYPLIPAWSKGYSGAAGNEIFPTEIIVSNGTMRHNQSGIVAMNTWDTTHTGGIADKDFIITFNNVTFGFVDGADSVGLVGHIWSATTTGGAPTVAAPFTITYNDCVFDVSTTKSKHNSALIFNINNTNFVKVTHIVNGGIIKSGGSAITLIKEGGSYGSSVTFNKGSDGNYITMEAPLSVSVPTNAVTTPEGTKYFVQDGMVGSNAKYSLTSYSVSTEYGSIPDTYKSAQSYPFVVFRIKNGANAQIIGYSTMAKAFDSAKAWNNTWDKLKDENGQSLGVQDTENKYSSVILLRRNYTTTTSDWYANWAQLENEVTLDLGGNTLIQGSGTNGLFYQVTSKGSSSQGFIFDSTYNVKNGNIAVNTNPVFYGNMWDTVYNNQNHSIANKKFTWNFECVTFEYVVGATETSMLMGYTDVYDSANYPPSANAPFYFNYKNCTFDLTNAPANVTLFNAAPDSQLHIKTVVNVYGCDIILSSKTALDLYTVESVNGSSVTFHNDGGKYITLTAPTGTKAPANLVKVDSRAECVFVKTSENDGYVNYGLYPEVMIGFKIKTSVTLWSNFVYNIYIPKTNVNGFAVNGTSPEYNEVEIDGVTYYRVSVNLAAGEALSDIALTVALNSGSTTVDANWTLDVLSYTKAIIAGEFDGTTKTLMKDMLAYASAAHTYFENTAEVSAKLSEIEAVIEGYTKEIPTGDAKKPTGKTYFTDVSVYLGAVPSFRFTLASGYTAEDFTFKVGNKVANVKAEDGYIEIVMYAYMMLDDVTFTVVDKTSGESVTESYNLYAYYEFAKSENDAALIGIVEGLMKYSLGAKAYRDSVIAVK